MFLKLLKPQFRRLFRHLCVRKLRFSATKPLAYIFALTKNPLELAAFPFRNTLYTNIFKRRRANIARRRLKMSL